MQRCGRHPKNGPAAWAATRCPVLARHCGHSCHPLAAQRQLPFLAHAWTAAEARFLARPPKTAFPGQRALYALGMGWLRPGACWSRRGWTMACAQADFQKTAVVGTRSFTARAVSGRLARCTLCPKRQGFEKAKIFEEKMPPTLVQPALTAPFFIAKKCFQPKAKPSQAAQARKAPGRASAQVQEGARRKGQEKPLPANVPGRGTAGGPCRPQSSAG